MTRALFPGTFDPFTVGHASIVSRALAFVDELIIAIGINGEKHTLFPLEQRLRMISRYYKDNPRVSVQTYEGLTTDFAQEAGATLIVRGIRSVRDFEYEQAIADINRRLTGVETVLLFTEPQLACVSSSMVRELLSFKKDVTPFLPEGMETGLTPSTDTPEGG